MSGSMGAAHDIDRWVEGVLAGLTLEEKAGLCSGADFWHMKAVERLGVDQIMVTDGPHGLRRVADGGSGLKGLPATCFPTAAGLASSWDPDLVEQVGAAIGREAIATKVSVVLGPGVNIKRHPLCGRNFEYFSEDPLLSGRMGGALIRGLTRGGVGASLKHYAANNQEGYRNVADSVVDERALREIYLASFEYAVREGDPATVMCGYNKVNGPYCSEHEWLLTTVLRDEWGWDGVVMSDWGAVNDRVAGVKAGLDLEMPGSNGSNDALIVTAVQEGRLGSDVLDRTVRRLLRLIATYRPREGAPDTFDIDEHHALARRAAADSTVLLTNDGVLPLAPAASIAIIGAFATEPRYQGAGSSQVTPTRLDTVLEAITAGVGGVVVSHARGYEAANDRLRPELIEEAVEVARGAEVAVVVVGLPSSYESEAFDRRHMRVPEQHSKLVEAVAAANPNTVVVLCGGSAMELPWADTPRAILLANLGGQAGGGGVADVLLGAVNPAGKLAETYPLRQSDHGSDAWFPGARQVQYREGIYVGYRWFDTVGATVRFPFGHGLSYTTFDVTDLSLSGATDADADGFAQEVSVTVTNTGSVAGAEVVQVYVRGPRRVIHRPDRELRGFAKLRLASGESQRITIRLDRRAFAFFDVAGHAWQVEPGAYDVLVGTSSRDIRLQSTVTLSSRFSGGAVAPGAGWVPSVQALADDATFAALLGAPIPAATAVRPFTRNSTIGEVSAVWPGRRLAKKIAAQMQQQVGDLLDDDSAKAMMETVLREMPLRALALMGGGRLDWKTLDRIVKVLNLWPFGKRKVR